MAGAFISSFWIQRCLVAFCLLTGHFSIIGTVVYSRMSGLLRVLFVFHRNQSLAGGV